MRRRARRSSGGTFRIQVSFKYFSAFLILCLFFAVMITVQKKLKSEAEVTTPAPHLRFEMFWQYDDPETHKLANIDLDLWVRCPDGKAVGYSSQGSQHCNLERDDLGNRPGLDDDDPINYELTTSRGLPAGEYCANAVLYRNLSSLTEARATLKASFVGGEHTANGGVAEPRVIFSEQVVLHRQYEEINVQCFTLTERGEVDPSKTYHSNSVCLFHASGCAGY